MAVLRVRKRAGCGAAVNTGIDLQCYSVPDPLQGPMLTRTRLVCSPRSAPGVGLAEQRNALVKRVGR